MGNGWVINGIGAVSFKRSRKAVEREGQETLMWPPMVALYLSYNCSEGRALSPSSFQNTISDQIHTIVIEPRKNGLNG